MSLEHLYSLKPGTDYKKTSALLNQFTVPRGSVIKIEGLALPMGFGVDLNLQEAQRFVVDQLNNPPTLEQSIAAQAVISATEFFSAAEALTIQRMADCCAPLRRTMPNGIWEGKKTIEAIKNWFDGIPETIRPDFLIQLGYVLYINNLEAPYLAPMVKASPREFTAAHSFQSLRLLQAFSAEADKFELSEKYLAVLLHLSACVGACVGAPTTASLFAYAHTMKEVASIPTDVLRPLFTSNQESSHAAAVYSGYKTTIPIQIGDRSFFTLKN
ncbi:MAG: hypothetical protein WC775_02935 [Patescibacteria group bacterium]|jgi:hypothetical protein